MSVGPPRMEGFKVRCTTHMLKDFQFGKVYPAIAPVQMGQVVGQVQVTGESSQIYVVTPQTFEIVD